MLIIEANGASCLQRYSAKIAAGAGDGIVLCAVRFQLDPSRRRQYHHSLLCMKTLKLQEVTDCFTFSFYYD